jgi:hypothetical protein
MFYFGLDLGQSQDPSASIILEAHGEGDTGVRCAPYRAAPPRDQLPCPCAGRVRHARPETAVRPVHARH